jgi:predicted metal-dependent peptidase
MTIIKHEIDIQYVDPPRAENYQRYTPEPEVEKRFRDALAYLVFKWQLFAQLIYSDMRMVYTEDVPIAATDSKTIFLNPPGFDKEDIKDVLELVFVLAHEVGHRIFNDLVLAVVWRATGQVLCADGTVLPYDPGLMNAAEDYRINGMLVHSKIGRMPKIGLYDKAISEKGMESSVEIYQTLWKQGRRGKDYGTGFDWHLIPGPDLVKADKGAREQALVAAAALAERTNPGSVPGAIKRLLDEILDPKIPWERVLRTTMQRSAGTPRMDWRFQDRRLAGRDLYFAKKGWNGAGAVVIGADNSGSINSQLMIDRFASEMAGIVADLKPSRFVVIWCDAAVTRVDVLEQPDDLMELFAKWKNTGVGGGGGTDFRPVFKEVRKLGIVPDSLVYFTDMYGTFPEKDPGYQVIWASITGDRPVPFGEVIYVEV